MSHKLEALILCFGLLAGCRKNQGSVSMDLKVCVPKAKEYINSGSPGKAIELLEKYIREHGNGSSGEISELLALACLSNGDEELAAFYFEEAASSSELKYYCYLKAAEIYEKLNDLKQAQLCYGYYLEVLPEDSEVQIKYANALLCGGQRKEALAILVDYAENDIALYNQIAELFFEFGNYIQARNWYLSTLNFEKNNPTALKGLWKVNLLLRDWKALLDIGKMLFDLGVNIIDDVSVLDVVEILKDGQRALAALNGIDVCFERVILPMFVIEGPIQRNSEMRDLNLKTQGTLVQEKPEVKNEKMEVLRIEMQWAKERGDFERAVEILWKILGLDTKNVDAWVDLTHCLLKINRYDTAEMAVQEVIKFCPNRIDFHLLYLDIVLRTHGSLDYVRVLKEEKRQFPENADMRLLWARAKEVYVGDVTGARRSYEKFLKLAPADHPEIVKVKSLLETYREN